MTKERSKIAVPSAAHVAEAAAWVAHLHNRGRTPDSDRGHNLWLKDAPARQRAWEVATEVWDDLRRMPTSAVLKELEATRAGVRARRHNAGLLTGLAATILIAVVALWALRNPAVATDVGEQRTVSLKDGTQLTLNTSTRVTVQFDKHQRRVELSSGEALFDVAQHAQWPFLVVAGDREIKALGTTFVVRRDRRQISVTLMDGKVSVSESSGTSALGAFQQGSTGAPHGEVVLSPGQRLTFGEKANPRLDEPSIEKVTAWRRGKVVFEGARLAEAISEMNRYSTQRLSVEDSRAADVRISGVFKYGDSLRFANAVAATYRLKVIEAEEEISIVGAPERAYR
jgi:transmembrane sensor